MKAVNLHVDWFRGIPTREDTKKKEIESIIRNSSVALSILKTIIEEKDTTLSNRIRNETNFESPVWAHNQAYSLGKMAAYTEVLQLLGFLNEQNRK